MEDSENHLFHNLYLNFLKVTKKDFEHFYLFKSIFCCALKQPLNIFLVLFSLFE